VVLCHVEGVGSPCKVLNNHRLYSSGNNHRLYSSGVEPMGSNCSSGVQLQQWGPSIGLLQAMCIKVCHMAAAGMLLWCDAPALSLGGSSDDDVVKVHLSSLERRSTVFQSYSTVFQSYFILSKFVCCINPCNTTVCRHASFSHLHQLCDAGCWLHIACTQWRSVAAATRLVTNCCNSRSGNVKQQTLVGSTQ
jgi:hypothetical protein